MPTIYYLPDDREIETTAGRTILQTSLLMGIPHTNVCAGIARCSTCRVMVVEGLESCSPRTEAEQVLSERLRFSDGIRLACQTRVDGDIKVRRLILDDEDAEVTSQLDATPGRIGEEKDVAIMFADIRGSTAFAEALPPYDLIHVMNRYFLRMGRVIAKHGGYIESYRGDGLMALFGVDEPRDAALRAVRAGLEMFDEVELLNPHLEATYRARFQIVIGVHYGQVVMGTVGFSDMRQMSAIGDSVNLAARIEDVNKEVDARLLVSEATYNHVRDHVEAGRSFVTSLKGKTGEHTLYEIIAGISGAGTTGGAHPVDGPSPA